MNQEPMDCFESILSNKDRFSWIQESGQELSDNLSGKVKSFGYEIKLFYRRDPEVTGDNRIAAVVVYTYAGSDAETKGLERGMWIGKVNGEDLDDENFNQLLFNTEQPQELAIGEVEDNGDFTTEQTITVTRSEEHTSELQSIMRTL